MKTAIKPNKKSVSAQKIKEEALNLASEMGWNKLTVRLLADRLNYTPPVLYQYFKNKEHLVSALAKDGFEELQQSLLEAKKSKATPAEQLLEVAKARYDFAVEHKSLHSLMFNPEASEWHKKSMMEAMAKTKALVTNLLRQISGREDSCHDLLLNFVAIIKGYVFFEIEIVHHPNAQSFIGDQNLKEALVTAIQRFINSISNE